MMGSRLLSEWIAYYQMEPFGEERADIRSAIVACTVANVNRGKDQSPYELDNFLPKWEEPEEQTVEEMIQIAAMFTAAWGGQIDPEIPSGAPTLPGV